MPSVILNGIRAWAETADPGQDIVVIVTMASTAAEWWAVWRAGLSPRHRSCRWCRGLGARGRLTDGNL